MYVMCAIRRGKGWYLNQTTEGKRHGMGIKSPYPRCLLHIRHEREADNHLYAYESKHRTRKRKHPMREGMSDLSR